MTDRSTLRAEAANARRGALDRGSLPCGEPKREDIKFHSEFRAEKTQRDGRDFYLVEGYASMTERAYEMWDFFGPYEEVVSRSAFDDTLAADPMVVYRFNHGGMSMANTRNKRLELWSDALGLGDRAWLNAERSDVQTLIHGIDDQDVTEQSFMFTIDDGEWNDDMTQFRINKVNLDRGDVGPVTYGANPHTVVAARSGELLAAIPALPYIAAREAYALLKARPDLAEQRTSTTTPSNGGGGSTAPSNGAGRSLRLATHQLEVDKLHH